MFLLFQDNEYQAVGEEARQDGCSVQTFEPKDSIPEDISQDLENILYMLKSTDRETPDDCMLDSDNESVAEMISPPLTLCDSDNYPAEDNDKRPLFPGSSVTIGSFMLLLALFTTKYNLIGDATQQLLNILSFVLPSGHILCNTLHDFKMFFKKLKNPLIFHYYCPHCHSVVKDQAVKECPHDKCGKQFDIASYFIEMPLKDQLQTLFGQEGFYDNLQHRFQRQVPFGSYEDIYDGELYQSHFQNGGFLREKTNLSFTFNTDGAAVFKSSNVSVWPLFLVINKLPYKLRMKKENMILASLWFGTKKPSMSTFLKPFQETFAEMYDGFQFLSPDIGKFTCRGILLSGTADLPARSLLCNHIQYNGGFACWKCEQQGESAAVGRGHTRVFPYDVDDPKGPQRTDENVMHYSNEAENTGRAVKGIKGQSLLSLFPCFSLVNGIAIDYMHGVLLGVEKLLLELWCTKKYKGKPFSLYASLSTINERLTSIRPTLDITRLPRSIIDLQHWKASEYRSFLLFYSAPVLHGILDDARFAHYILLVNSMHILLKSGSYESDLKRAEEMLFEFCRQFAHYYDSCFMRLNLHQLLHLPDCVRKLGPLYTSSCFSFEDKNGVLLKMIRGTQNFDNQILTGVSFVQKLPELKNKCVEKGTELEMLYNSIETPAVLKRTLSINNGFHVLGGISEKVLKDDETNALRHYLGADHLQNKFLSFNRIELNGSLIYGTAYTRMIKRDNSVVEYVDAAQSNKQFGKVRFFFSTQNPISSESSLAILDCLKCQKYDSNANILAVNSTNKVQVIPACNIVSSCMLISFKNERKMYVGKFPNTLESD